MSLNNHINGSIKEYDEIYSRFNQFPDIENFQEFVDNMEEFPQNMNFGVFDNINQVEQNEAKNEIQNDPNETKDGTHNVQNEQNETQIMLILSSNLEEKEDKKEEEKEAVQIPQEEIKKKPKMWCYHRIYFLQRTI